MFLEVFNNLNIHIINSYKMIALFMCAEITDTTVGFLEGTSPCVQMSSITPASSCDTQCIDPRSLTYKSTFLLSIQLTA